jgi:hypothetical protein
MLIGSSFAGVAASAPAEETHVMRLYSSGPRALAMLTLGDGPPAPVVFDTGTDENILSEAYAKRLKLKIVGSSPMIDGATLKRTMQPLVGLKKPRLGGAPVTPATAQMVKYDEADVVGIFGPGSFAGSLVTIELDRGRARIDPLTADRIPAGPATPYRDGLPDLQINVAGTTIGAHLDSGSTGEIGLPKSMLGKVPLKAPPQVIGQAQSMLGTQDIYGGQLDGDIVIGPLKLHDPQIEFFGVGSGANIGYSVMKQLTVLLDPAGKRSWVLDPSDLKGPLDQFAGKFGVRTLRADATKLVYQRDGRPPYELHYLGGDLFEIEETGDRVQFRRSNGKVAALELITADGQVVRADRDS